MKLSDLDLGATDCQPKSVMFIGKGSYEISNRIEMGNIMAMKNKLRGLSYLILGIGVICIALSQGMKRFRYEEMTEIRRDGPLGYGYDNETIYWWDACVNHEPGYRYSTNSTLGTLSRGEIIEIERFGFGGAEEGYAWNEKAY